MLNGSTFTLHFPLKPLLLFAATAVNKRLRLYTHQIVQVEYTDEEGNTGLANVILEGGEIIANVNAGESYSDFSFIDFPTAEDYESWSGKKTFVSWVR